MSNKWNNIIREKLESHEVPADHMWNNISQNIPQSSSSFWKPWMTTAAVGTVAIATSAIIYFNSPRTLEPITQTTEQVNNEEKVDTTSNTIQNVEYSAISETPQIVTGGLPDDFVSGYVWDFPEDVDSTAKSEKIVCQGINVVKKSDATDVHKFGAEVIKPIEPLTNSFTAVVSNAEDLRFFFFGAAENADVYAWNFGDGFNGQGQSVTHQFSDEGTYTVNYMVTKGEQVLLEEKTIEVYRPAKLSPVTAFAPGFDGKNDTFDVLYNARNISEVVKFEITDANGRKVYQSGGQTVWDGKNMDGELCQPAYYYWLIEFKDRQGNLKSQTGAIRIFAE